MSFFPFLVVLISNLSYLSLVFSVGIICLVKLQNEFPWLHVMDGILLGISASYI
jgi:hypothetical protein